MTKKPRLSVSNVELKPSTKARMAGATPNDIYTLQLNRGRYEVSERVEFLSQERTGLSPACHTAVQNVKDPTKRQQPDGHPKVKWVRLADVIDGGGDGEEAACTVSDGEHVSKVEFAHE
jgi:hypothetical protein